MTTDPLTIYDLQEREDARVDVRQLPRLARYGVRLTMAAGRREFITSTILQVASGIALGARPCSTRRASTARSPR